MSAPEPRDLDPTIAVLLVIIVVGLTLTGGFVIAAMVASSS